MKIRFYLHLGAWQMDGLTELFPWHWGSPLLDISRVPFHSPLYWHPSPEAIGLLTDGEFSKIDWKCSHHPGPSIRLSSSFLPHSSVQSKDKARQGPGRDKWLTLFKGQPQGYWGEGWFPGHADEGPGPVHILSEHLWVNPVTSMSAPHIVSIHHRRQAEKVLEAEVGRSL